MAKQLLCQTRLFVNWDFCRRGPGSFMGRNVVDRLRLDVDVLVSRLLEMLIMLPPGRDRGRLKEDEKKTKKTTHSLLKHLVERQKSGEGRDIDPNWE